MCWQSAIGTVSAGLVWWRRAGYAQPLVLTDVPLSFCAQLKYKYWDKPHCPRPDWLLSLLLSAAFADSGPTPTQSAI
jgi:hypothetical protein